MKLGCVAIVLHLGISAVSAAEDPCPTSLVVVPGARDLRCAPSRGTIQVAYSLTSPYPATQVLSSLNDSLRTQDWLPLHEDFMNPGLESSHARGWTSFEDATVDPPRSVHQWLADWVNLKGEILRFSLRYSLPKGSPAHLEALDVVGILIPREVAKAGREEARRHLTTTGAGPPNHRLEPTAPSPKNPATARGGSTGMR